MLIPHKVKNKGKYISFHYLRGWKARKIRKVQEISPQIPIDGKEIESCGDTCIFAQDALKADVDFTQEDIESNASGKITDNTAIAGVLNKYKNMFGKARVVVIKSQLGQPIVAYSGEDVYWEIPDDLPKFTKLMIDGKALYIHRANFQIIDKSLLESN